MGKRKWMGIVIAVLVALLAGPSLSAAQEEIERINESFAMGDTGCQMNVVLDGGTGAILSADLGPAFEPPAPPPPPMGNSFDFTGAVDIVTGTVPVPFGVSGGEVISGNITYNPLNFTLLTTNDYSKTYQGLNTVGFDVARIWVIYNIGPDQLQRFDTHNNSPVISVVANDQPVGEIPVPFDTFDLVTDYMDSAPPLLYSPKSAFVLKNEGGTAITSTDIPTGLNSTDWPSPPSYFEIYYFDPTDSSKFWSVSATINLTPAPTIAVASTAILQTTAPEWCTGPLTVKNIRDTLVCKDCFDPDGDGIYTCSQANCEPKTAVERNIMEKSGDGSEYCYYTKTGDRVCKTI